MENQRWYEIINNHLYIYDSPLPELSVSVSICKLSDLKFYRTKFNLRKIYE